MIRYRPSSNHKRCRLGISERYFTTSFGTLRETKVFGFRGKYSCEAEIAAPSVTTASKDEVGFRKPVLCTSTWLQLGNAFYSQ